MVAPVCWKVWHFREPKLRERPVRRLMGINVVCSWYLQITLGIHSGEIVAGKYRISVQELHQTD